MGRERGDIWADGNYRRRMTSKYMMKTRNLRTFRATTTMGTTEEICAKNMSGAHSLRKLKMIY